MKTSILKQTPLIGLSLILSLLASSATPATPPATAQKFTLSVTYNTDGGRVILGNSPLLPGDYSEELTEGQQLIFRPMPNDCFSLTGAYINGQDFISDDGVFYYADLNKDSNVEFRFEKDAETPDDSTVVGAKFYAL